jgi:hypothetical protein
MDGLFASFDRLAAFVLVSVGFALAPYLRYSGAGGNQAWFWVPALDGEPVEASILKQLTLSVNGVIDGYRPVGVVVCGGAATAVAEREGWAVWVGGSATTWARRMAHRCVVVSAGWECEEESSACLLGAEWLYSASEALSCVVSVCQV